MAPVIIAAAALLALAKSSLASPLHSRRPCIDFQLPVAVEATQSVLDVPRVDNNIDAVKFIWNLETWSSPNLTERVKGEVQVKQTFLIGARLCVPEHGHKKNTLHIATHGGGFAKS